jgi:hypothetical protein
MCSAVIGLEVSAMDRSGSSMIFFPALLLASVQLPGEDIVEGSIPVLLESVESLAVDAVEPR